MKISVNNKIEICETNNLLQFLENLKIDLENVIIIYNKQIIKKINLDKILLNENDNLEIINFVDGG